MNTFSKLAIVAALFAGTSGLALAQQAEPQPPAEEGPQMMQDHDGPGQGRHHGMGRHGERGEHGGRGDRAGRMMRLIDANGDNAIGDDEAAAMAEHAFMRLDRNEDGTLDKAEFAPLRHRGFGGWLGLRAEEDAAVQKVREDRFVGLDADKDGKLTKAEFFTAARARLAAADTDKDGKVTPWEFRAAN